MKKRIMWLATAMVFAIPGQVLADEVEDEMRRMLNEGKPTEAYELGLENRTRLGENEFDLLFGLAALNGGRAGEGVLALERYRMSNPGDDGVWLALIRGYILLGEYGLARSELEDFLAADPEESLAATASDFLDLVRTREEQRLASSTAWLEAGLGYDSNVNGGPGSEVVVLPIFGRVALDPGLTESDDGLATLAGGVAHNRVLRPGLTGFVEADGGIRGYFDESDYSLFNLGAKAGLKLNRGGMLWRAALSHHSTWMDGDRYRSVHGLGGEWVNPFASNKAISAFLQYARFDYGEKGGEVRDSDFWGMGLGWRQSFGGAWKPLLSLSATLGDERNAENRDDLSRLIYGGGIQLNLSPAPKWGLYLGYTIQLSRYDEDDPLLLTTREDDNHYLRAGLTYLINRRWSLRGELSYNDNSSNIELNSYERTQAIIKLRYDFR